MIEKKVAASKRKNTIESDKECVNRQSSINSIAILQKTQASSQVPTFPEILELHKTIGNQAVGELLKGVAKKQESVRSKKVVQKAFSPTRQKKSSRKLGPQDIKKNAAQGVRGSGHKIPYLQKIQKSFGKHNIRDTKAYTHSTAQEASKSINAKAYATENKIAFSEKNPSLKNVAHEVTHVVQQRHGVNLVNGIGKVGDPYEKMADRVADTVDRGKSAEPILDEYVSKQKSVKTKNTQTQAIQMDGFTKLAPDKAVETQAKSIQEQLGIKKLSDISIPETLGKDVDRAKEIEADITYNTIRKKERSGNTKPIPGLARNELKILQGVDLPGYYQGGHLIADSLIEGHEKDSFIPANLAPQASDLNAPTYSTIMEDKIKNVVSYPGFNVKVHVDVTLDYPGGGKYKVSVEKLIDRGIIEGKKDTPNVGEVTLAGSKQKNVKLTDKVEFYHRIPNKWKMQAFVAQKNQKTPLDPGVKTKDVFDSKDLVYDNTATAEVEEKGKSNIPTITKVKLSKEIDIASDFKVDPSFPMKKGTYNNMEVLMDKDQRVFFISKGLGEKTAKENYVSNVKKSTDDLKLGSVEAATEKGKAGFGFDSSLIQDPTIGEPFIFNVEGEEYPSLQYANTTTIKVVGGKTSINTSKANIDSSIKAQLSTDGSYANIETLTDKNSGNVLFISQGLGKDKAYQTFMEKAVPKKQSASSGIFSGLTLPSGRARNFEAKQWTPEVGKVRDQDIISWLKSAFVDLNSSSTIIETLLENIDTQELEENAKKPFDMFASFLEYQKQTFDLLRESQPLPLEISKKNELINKKISIIYKEIKNISGNLVLLINNVNPDNRKKNVQDVEKNLKTSLKSMDDMLKEYNKFIDDIKQASKKEYDIRFKIHNLAFDKFSPIGDNLFQKIQVIFFLDPKQEDIKKSVKTLYDLPTSDKSLFDPNTDLNKKIDEIVNVWTKIKSHIIEEIKNEQSTNTDNMGKTVKKTKSDSDKILTLQKTKTSISTLLDELKKLKI